MDLDKSVRFSEDVTIRMVEEYISKPQVSHHQMTDDVDCRRKDSDYYFTFYASLLNQYVLAVIWSLSTLMPRQRSNMIRDVMRTGTYRRAILGNGAVAFKDKVVLDVGAGQWYLS